MSLVAIPFAVDVAKVKSIFGSRDRDLLESIKHSGLYADYASQDSDFPDPAYHYDFDQALEDILFRYIKPSDRKARSGFLGFGKSKPSTGLNPAIAHGYGYVMLVVCDYFGTHLMPDCDGFYYGRTFEAAVAIMKENGLTQNMNDLFEQHEVFDIPAIKDFPAIKCFTKQEIAHINKVMTKVPIDEDRTDMEAEDFDEVQEMLMHIRDSFRRCQEEDVEMLTFTH